MARSKSLSDKQLAANRRNARLSTGPRTPEGKASSRWNALKHGVLSKALIPQPLAEQESRREYDRLLAALTEDLGCATALEEMLVERVAACYWRLARLARAEAGAVAERRRRARDLLRSQRETRMERGQLTSSELVIKALRESLGDPERLRSMLAALDAGYASVPAGQLAGAAEEIIRQCEGEVKEERARREQIEDDAASIPPLDVAHSFARYEAHLERQIFRALSELERLQRLRLGQAVPPPLNVSVELTGEAGED